MHELFAEVAGAWEMVDVDFEKALEGFEGAILVGEASSVEKIKMIIQ